VSTDALSPVKRALVAVERMQARLDAVERARTEPVAIIGMSCRFPGGANDPESFWRLLREGVDAVTEPPDGRWARGEIERLRAAGYGAACWGGFVDAVDRFDPAFFGISGREAAAMDPQQRLLLEVSWEALERSGHAPDGLSGSATGVFVGICSSEYAWNHVAAPDGVDAYASTGTAYSLVANRLSYLLNLQGPSMAVDTACSSSLVAVHLACHSLRSGESRLAIVGGVNLTLFPEGSVSLAKWGMLAGDGRCKTFDTRADGYVRGEGCGVIVLKRLSEAQADGDPILAVIRGSAVNQDGRSAGLTAPNLLAQQSVIRQALANARVAPERIGYLEAHGTGTPLGDPIEMESLTAVIGRPRADGARCVVGSVKTNIGHLEAAAGIAGLIKVVLSLQHREIPPLLHFQELNPNIAIDDTPFAIATQLMLWPSSGEPRCAGVSAFGFGGTNSHVVVEEAPVGSALPATASERPLHVLALSAKSAPALDQLWERYERFLADPERPAWPDVCFTANSGRNHFQSRLAIIAPSADEARSASAVVIRGGADGTVQPKVAFLFTGQGSAYENMGRQLYDTQPSYRGWIDQCGRILEPLMDRPLLEVLFGSSGRAEALEQTQYAQPALFALEYALARLWRTWGVEPALLLGHSLGEYVAACVAGIFSLEDALRLIAARGRLMQAAPRGTMAAIFTDEAHVTPAISRVRDRVSIAALNGSAETVIAGDAACVAELVAQFQAAGIRTRTLPGSVAFHSPLMVDVQARFAAEVASAGYAPPRIGIIGGVTGHLTGPEELNRADYWLRQMCVPVRFGAGLETLRSRGVTVLVEIGPTPTLLGIQRHAQPDAATINLPSLRQGVSDWEQMLRSLSQFYVAGGRVDWAAVDRDFPRRRVVVPTYPFQRGRYWLDVPSTSADASRPAQGSSVGERPSLYTLEWRARTLPPPASTITPGRWLVFADSSDLGDRLAQHLRRRGEDAVVAARGSSMPEHLRTEWRGVVYLGALDAPPTPIPFPQALEQSVRDPLMWAQALLRQKNPSPVWWITRGAHAIGTNVTVAAPVQAPLWGLATSLAAEHPERSWNVLDLDPDSSAEDAASSLATLLLADAIAEPRLALRGETLYVPRLVAAADSGAQQVQGGSTGWDAGALRVTAEGTYLVTGGRGAVGLALAHQLVEQGARRVVLASRRPPDASQQRQLDALRQSGAEVVALELDVADLQATRALVASMKVKGVIHAAGVIDDGLLLSQDWDRVCRVLAPKVAGAWNLHLSTEDQDLDFFILCSSAGHLLGRAGQAGYGAANAFLDGLAHLRRGRGLPSLSVDWGPIATAGMAAQVSGRVRAEWAAAGIGLIQPSVLGETVTRASRVNRPQVAAIVADWTHLPSGVPPLLSELIEDEVVQPPYRRTSSDASIEDIVLTTVKDVLSWGPEAAIEPDRPFGELGFDSLMAVDLRNRLAQRLERPLPATLLFDYPTFRKLVEYLGGVRPARVSEQVTPTEAEASVAIIGMACRFPGGVTTPEDLWTLLSTGTDAIREVPPERWDTEAYYSEDPSVPGRTNTRWGGFVDGVDRFDARFFGISPREALSMDPQQRMLLEVTWEALERAGVPPVRLAGSLTGVFVGISSNEYAQLNTNIDAYTGTGSAPSVAAGRLSYVLGLQGPCMALDTACSSSLVAVHQACQSLRLNECNLAVAGGVSLLLNPAGMVYVSKLGVMAADGRCKTFDARADGYVRSEGCGMVVLKRLADALRDGDPVRAVIRGSAVNQDGRSSGLTAPSGPAQEAVIRTALMRAGIDPCNVAYVEAHGTGTALGDPIEIQALASALCEGREGSRPLLVGSVKTNMGHLEAAAGVAGLLKAVLAVQHGEIPPHLHFHEPNPHISWEELPVRVPIERTPWPASYSTRVAGVSSFGFSGTNAHVVLEAPPVDGQPPASSDGPHLLAISARTAEALKAMALAYRRVLDADALDVRDVCYTTSLRRNHFEERLAVVGASAEELRSGLDAWMAGDGAKSHRPTAGSPRLAFVFPGQGSQWEGMCRQLLSDEPVFRQAIELCHQELASEVGWSLIEVLTEPERSGLPADIDVVQPVLFSVQVGLAALWRSWGIVPDAVVGHSMGEVAAAHTAGVLSLRDAVRVVARRSRLLRTLPAGRGGMLQVELSREAAEALIAPYGDRLAVAVCNGPRATVLSGSAAVLEELATDLERRDVFVRKVKVDVAAHSPQVEPLRERLLDALKDIAPQAAAMPMYSTVDGRRCDGRSCDALYWVKNLREPVLFAAATDQLMVDGYTVFVEISPHPLLLPAIDDRLRERRVTGAALPSLRRGEDGRAPLLSTLGALYTAGRAIDWAALFPSGGRHVALPTYQWDHQSYWLESRSASPRAMNARWPGEKLRSPAISGTVFESHMSPAVLPWLEDHLLDGRAVVAGATHLSLALSAVREVLGAAPLRLEDIEFPRMLVFGRDETRTVHCTVTPVVEARRSCRVYSADEHDDEEWALHLSAAVSVADGSDAVADVSSIRARCPEMLAGEEFYRLLGGAGYQLGSTFRWIDQIWCGEGEVLGRMRQAAAGDDAGRYLVPPGLLDSCFQLVGATIGADAIARLVNEHLVTVPIGLGALQLNGPARGELWCHVSIHEGSSAEEVLADAHLLDDTGRTVMSVHRFRARRVARGTVARIGADRARDWLYQLQWQPADVVAAVPTPASAGDWLVLSDRGGIGAALAAILERQGERCTLIERADQTSLQWFRQVLRPCRGIVHLWGLDTPPAYVSSDDPACFSVLHLVQALAQAGWRDAPRLYLVTRGAQAAIAGDEIAPAQTTLWGLGRTIALEHPELGCTRIDLSSETAPDGDAAIRALARELFLSSREDQIALRGEERYVLRLVRASFKPRPELSRVSADASYLITGGLGGVGITVARWLIERGARHLVLLGRSAREGEAVAELRASGAEILVVQADVADEGQLAGALDRLDAAMPPLRGVMHAAAVLDDGILLQLTPERFRTVLDPKAVGAWNLHKLTERRPLDFFVLFSSLASLLGSPGQASYAAANAFLDGLAAYRRARGLPALSINWGPWADVGQAAAEARRGERLAQRGVASIQPSLGLEALGLLLPTDVPQVGVMEFNLRQWREFYPAAAHAPLLAQLREEQHDAAATQPAGYMRPVLQEAKLEERRSMLLSHVQQQVGQVLRMSPDQIDPDVALGSLGLDSLMGLEVRNRLEASFGVTLSATLAWTYPTLSALTTYLAERMDLPLAEISAHADAESDRLEQIADRIAQLSEDEMEALLIKRLEGA
jgi:myxalamid-type polyketide synthase MxaC